MATTSAGPLSATGLVIEAPPYGRAGRARPRGVQDQGAAEQDWASAFDPVTLHRGFQVGSALQQFPSRRGDAGWLTRLLSELGVLFNAGDLFTYRGQAETAA